MQGVQNHGMSSMSVGGGVADQLPQLGHGVQIATHFCLQHVIGP